MQNKLITLTAAAAAMTGMAVATDSASNAGQNTKTVLETITSTASVCPASAAGLPEVTVTSTFVLSTTVEAADCGPTTTKTPVKTETKTVTATSEPSTSSKLSSNEVGPTTGDVFSASSSQIDSTIHKTSTITATALSTVSTITSTQTNTKTVTGTIYPIPANSSGILGTGTGVLPPFPSGTGAYPSNSITPFTGGATAVGMSSVFALGVMAAGAFFLF